MKRKVIRKSVGNVTKKCQSFVDCACSKIKSNDSPLLHFLKQHRPTSILCKRPEHGNFVKALPLVLTQKGCHCFVKNKTIKIFLSQNKFIEACVTYRSRECTYFRTIPWEHWLIYLECVQGTPKLTIEKLRPAWYRSTSRSVVLSDKFVFTHGFINVTLSTALLISYESER